MDSNYQGGIDLHVHSNASDGTHSPAELFQIAARLGLEAISITDHDTTAGSQQAMTCERPASLAFISGVEISAEAPPHTNIKNGLHILGYGIDPYDSPLVETLETLKLARENRTRDIVQRLNELGIPLTLAEVDAEVGDATPGRPHVAKALVKAGFAENINDAFDRYIGNGAPACVGKKRLTSKQAVDLIIAAGGIPVLAHPCLIKNNAEILEALIDELCQLGLMGLEVYYPDHSPEDVERYLRITQAFGLLATGGSDFHGQLIPEIELGRGRGDLYVPYALFEKLRQHQNQINPK